MPEVVVNSAFQYYYPEGAVFGWPAGFPNESTIRASWDTPDETGFPDFDIAASGFDLVNVSGLPTSGTLTNLRFVDHWSDEASFVEITGFRVDTSDWIAAYNAQSFEQFLDIVLGGNDQINGSGENDVLFGLDGNDDISGHNGNDTLIGGADSDRLDGGEGMDVASYYYEASGVHVDLRSGLDPLGIVSDDILINVENILGSDHADWLGGDDSQNKLNGGPGDDTLEGGNGADEIVGGAGYDLASYSHSETGLTVNLTDPSQNSGAALGDTYFGVEGIVGSNFNDTLIGQFTDDVIVGGGADDEVNGANGNDTLEGGGGNDTLEGGSGQDTAIYTGNQTSYTLTLSPSATTVTDRRPDGEGTDNLLGVELLDFDTEIAQFENQPMDLQVFGGPSALTAYQLESFIELYIAYFNRAPDAIGLNFWGTAFASGTTLEEMAALFEPQPETQSAYPAGTSNEVFATSVYNNVLGRTPDQSGIDFWIQQLDEGNVTRDQFILQVLQGAKSDLKPELGQAFVDQQLADQAYLETKTDLGAYFAVHKGMSDLQNAAGVMALFDGTQVGLGDAVAAVDDYYSEALDPLTGEFLMPLVGVLDDPSFF